MTRSYLVVVPLVSSFSSAYAADQGDSSSYWVSQCKAFLERKIIKSADDPDICVGVVVGIGYMLTNWSTEDAICADIPKQVTYGQMVRVVVRHIEQRPQRMHEDFRQEAMFALIRAWPCKSR